MVKLAITGATGYLGSAFIKRYSTRFDIFCIVRKDSDIKILSESRCRIIKYGEWEELYEKMKVVSPDILVHLAGVFLNEHNENTIINMLECNIMFSTVIVDAAVCAGCKRIINTSSYWQHYNKERYNPVNLYAATKQSFEDILLYYVKAKESSVITLTIFDTYGPFDKRRKVLNLVMETEDGKEFGMSDGSQKMYFCYLDDLIDAYGAAIKRCMAHSPGTYEKYALRDEKPVTLRYAVETLLEVLGKKVKINWGKVPNRKREISDPENIGTVLPEWKPSHTLKEGAEAIKKMYSKIEKEFL